MAAKTLTTIRGDVRTGLRDKSRMDYKRAGDGRVGEERR
jgi:hypothetical protein